MKLMILAGEASGERHGADLIRALRHEFPGIKFEFFGSGGAEMRQAGAEILVDIHELGIFGMVETGRALIQILKTFRFLRRSALERRPQGVIFIDWPEFNLRLAKTLKRAGLTTVYYISPQIWAWRRYRLRIIKRFIDRMIVILPFELDFYKQANLTVDFVGHPLLDSVRATQSRPTFCMQHSLDPQKLILSLLPGSRRSELQHILPIMIEASHLLPEPQPQIVIPLATTVPRNMAERLIDDTRNDMARRQSHVKGFDQGEHTLAPPEFTLIEQDTYNALASSDLAIVASGTATLETALLETPMVIVYRSSMLNWHLVRPLLNIDTFGLVNLIAGRKIVPEIIQRDLTPNHLAETASSLLQNEDKRAAMKKELIQIRDRLGEGNASFKAARIIMDTVCRGNSAHSP